MNNWKYYPRSSLSISSWIRCWKW